MAGTETATLLWDPSLVVPHKRPTSWPLRLRTAPPELPPRDGTSIVRSSHGPVVVSFLS